MGASSSGRYPRSNNLRVASDPIVPLKTDPGRPCANIRLLACANGEILDVCTITGRNLAGKPQPDVGRRRGGRPLTDRQRRKLCFRASHAFERSEEHTSELQSLMRISYAVFCLKKKKQQHTQNTE